MTSSGLCYKCKKISNNFHYNKPFNGSGHDSFWHCDEHGPQYDEKIITETAKGNYLNYGMNRAERRALKKKGKLLNDNRKV